VRMRSLGRTAPLRRDDQSCPPPSAALGTSFGVRYENNTVDGRVTIQQVCCADNYSAGLRRRGIRFMIRAARMRLVYALIAALLLATPLTRAQDAAMAAAAAKMADAISHAKQKTVVVFDFTGPDKQLTGLGKKLADDFSAALAKSAQKFQVADRSRVDEELKANLYTRDIVLDPGSILLVAQDLQAKAFVVGELSLDQGKLSVTLASYRTDGGKEIKALRVSTALTDAMKGLLAESLLETDPTNAFAAYPKPGGSSGYTLPSCLYCPRADYSEDAKNRRIEGVVELETVVGEDGNIRDVRVRKALPGGLTAEAIRTVRKWKLKPALGPDGKPAAVRQAIQITFQLY
jgi:TonB family protein